jgi:hypothetical protein
LKNKGIHIDGMKWTVRKSLAVFLRLFTQFMGLNRKNRIVGEIRHEKKKKREGLLKLTIFC